MNEGDLKKFITFTKDLLVSLKGKHEYAWFFDLFQKEIFSCNLFTYQFSDEALNSKFDSITEIDIQRIKAYLNFIDRKAINYGRVFYKDIINEELRNNLITDFKEMKIALKQDDIIEFGRRLCLQIENIYNVSLSNLDIHQTIENNKEYYSKINFKWSENANSYEYDFYKSFFSFDKNTNVMVPNELSKISFNTKSVLLCHHFKFYLNKSNIDDIAFLRNKGSHRDKLNEEDANRLTRILSRFDNNYSFYYRLLLDVKNGIKNI